MILWYDTHLRHAPVQCQYWGTQSCERKHVAKAADMFNPAASVTYACRLYSSFIGHCMSPLCWADLAYPLRDDDNELAIDQLGMDATQRGIALERNFDVDRPAGPGSQRCLQICTCTMSGQLR